MTEHAEHRPPSSAARWLSCPASVTVMPLYAGEDSDASVAGTIAHQLLATAIEWGIVPDYWDIDMVYRVQMAYEYYLKTLKDYGQNVEAYTEVRLDIPETGEFGTTDIIFVTKSLIHIIDYKDGYVPVDVRKNAQCMTYLLGAIARFGERPNYKITIIQPKYVHKDGMIRHDDITPDDIAWFRNEVQHAMTQSHFSAGKHCRKTYCPHRGTCAAFAAWAVEHPQDAFFPSDFNAMTDLQLGEMLDLSDILQGYRDQLRAEALRRMTRMDRIIPGYDVKKGRSERRFSNGLAQDRVFAKMRELGATDADLYEKVPVSVAGVERFFKKKYRGQGRGAFMQPFAECIAGNVTGGDNALVVEKDIDGRKSWKKGQEFGPLKTLPDIGV